MLLLFKKLSVSKRQVMVQIFVSLGEVLFAGLVVAPLLEGSHSAFLVLGGLFVVFFLWYASIRITN